MPQTVLDRQPVLEGPLIRLRPLEPRDFEELFAISSDPLVWEQHPSKDRGDETVFRGWFADALGSGGALVAIEHRTGRIIGTSRFAPRRDQVEIGWTFLARSHWGGAYNGEMKRLMLGHAFRSVDTVVFVVHSLNVRSQRAVERLGAVRVGEEDDCHGRGRNVVFQLDSATWSGPG